MATCKLKKTNARTWQTANGKATIFRRSANIWRVLAHGHRVPLLLTTKREAVAFACHLAAGGSNLSLKRRKRY